MKELSLAQPMIRYDKGDEFKGLMFNECASGDTVDKVAQDMDKEKPQIGGTMCGARQTALSIYVRLSPSYSDCVGRQLLKPESLGKGEVNVKEKDLIMTVGKVPVL